MQLINNLVYYTNIIAIVTVIIFVIVVGILLLFKYVWKPKAKDEKNASYDNYTRKDSNYYVPIDDIVNDMIVVDDYNRFISVITCYGSDYDPNNLDDCKSKYDGYVSFFNTINGPIQKRIYCSNVDLEENIIQYNEINDNLKITTEEYIKDMELIQKRMKSEQLSQSEKVLMIEKYNELNRKIDNNIWQIKHIEHLIEYMKELSGPNMEPIREDTYVIDWLYVKDTNGIELTKEQKIEKAVNELNAKFIQFRSALSNSRVRVKRMDNRELEECFRKHYQPITSSIFKDNDVMNSNTMDRIVESKSSEYFETKYKETMDKELLDMFMTS